MIGDKNVLTLNVTFDLNDLTDPFIQGKAFKVDSSEIASLFNFDFELSDSTPSISTDDVINNDENDVIDDDSNKSDNYARKMNNKVDF